MKAFEAAVSQGAMFIETDVHLSKDKIVVMSHDPSLDRVTNGKGLIKDINYVGGIDQLWTKKEPHQRMPTLKETIEFLTRPENAHVGLNLDIKMTNPPEELFQGIHEVLKAYPDYERVFSRKRVVLGIWHPKFIKPAQRILPYLGLAHIGVSTRFAREYFWDACDGFSMEFQSMVGAGGASFRADCAASGKKIMVWTVNERLSMIQAAKWGNCDAVLTDHPERFTQLRSELMGANGQKIRDEVTWRFAWSRIGYFTAYRYYFDRLAKAHILKIGGPIEANHTLPDAVRT